MLDSGDLILDIGILGFLTLLILFNNQCCSFEHLAVKHFQYLPVSQHCTK